MDVSKLVLNDDEIDDLSFDIVAYAKKKICEKNNATAVNFENWTFFDLKTKTWKPICISFADVLDIGTYGSQRMYDALFVKAVDDDNKKTAKKSAIYGSKNILRHIVHKSMGRESLTINEIADMLETLFGE